MLTLNGNVLRKAKSIPYGRLKISLMIPISYDKTDPIL
jgi:hypothetical protein